MTPLCQSVRDMIELTYRPAFYLKLATSILLGPQGLQLVQRARAD